MGYTWEQAAKIAETMPRDPDRVFGTAVVRGGGHVFALVRGNELLAEDPNRGMTFDQLSTHQDYQNAWDRMRPLLKPRKINDKRADALWKEMRVLYLTRPAA